MSILYLINDLIQSKQFDKAAPFHVPLKRLKSKSLSSGGVIKRDNIKSYTCYIL